MLISLPPTPNNDRNVEAVIRRAHLPHCPWYWPAHPSDAIYILLCWSNLGEITLGDKIASLVNVRLPAQILLSLEAFKILENWVSTTISNSRIRYSKLCQFIWYIICVSKKLSIYLDT